MGAKFASTHHQYFPMVMKTCGRPITKPLFVSDADVCAVSKKIKNYWRHLVLISNILQMCEFQYKWYAL